MIQRKASQSFVTIASLDTIQEQLAKPLAFERKSFMSGFGDFPSKYYRNFNYRPELVAIALVYLVQGLLGLSRLAVFTFFKNDLGLDPATVGILTGFGYAPWMIKPLYGFLSDSVPLWGYKRRSYLVLCGGLGTLSWLLLASPSVVYSPTAAVLALVLGSASTACADVVADSIVVELSRDQNATETTAGSLQSLCWAFASAGGIISAYFSGSLVDDLGARPVFLVTSVFPLLVALAALTIPEVKINKKKSPFFGSNNALHPMSVEKNAEMISSVKAQAKALWGALSQQSILYPAIFVFLWQATPTADTAMLFFETNELQFTNEVLGRIRLVAALSSLLGVGVYNFFLKKTPLRKVFLWTGLLGTGLGLTQLLLVTRTNKALGLSDGAFALADSALLTVLGQVSFMPVLVLAARLCPAGVEATLFATLMSLLNGGAFIGSAFGALLTKAFGVTATDFSHLAMLITVCTLGTLAPLPLLSMVPPTFDVTIDEELDERKEV